MVSALAGSAGAQSLPAPWTSRDIGAPALSGSATQSSGVFTINAAGTDIWNTSDQFHFVYQQVSGDVDIVARVDSITYAAEWSKVGVMIRASLSADSAHGFTIATAGEGVYFQRRRATAATSRSTDGAPVFAPVWLRAVRAGSRVTSYWSANGTSWTTIGYDTIALGSPAYVGIALSSVNPGTRSTARVSNVLVTQAGGALPSGQQSADIGSPAIAGTTTYSGGTYTIRAAGADIWDLADQFHFVYQPMSGNGELIARVASITNAHAWSKAGVMIRESLNANSRHAVVVASAGKGYAFQRRPDPGAYSESTSGGSGTPPGWVRLVRTGDLFEAYRSANGTSWTRIGSDTIPMGATVYVGLAVTSHNTAAATTAVVDNLRITSTGTGNSPPAVSLTSPAPGSTFTAPATVTLTASATDPENRMLSVDFYAGSTLIVRDTAAPYSASWLANAAGTYALSAVAHDADGGTTTSTSVSVTVQGANRAPTVALTSPSAGASFTAPAAMTLSANASDPENQLARVEFFSGTTRLGSDTTAPYSFSWSGVAAGTYSITAVAYDTSNASATSAAVTVTVTAPTSTAPRLVVFNASTDHATNVTSYLLKIFAAGANPSTATPVATSDLGRPTPVNGEITVDRATFFTGLAVGNYQATITAIGPGGQTPSAAVAFTR